jgi:hypothetical protein
MDVPQSLTRQVITSHDSIVIAEQKVFIHVPEDLRHLYLREAALINNRQIPTYNI